MSDTRTYENDIETRRRVHREYLRRWRAQRRMEGIGRTDAIHQREYQRRYLTKPENRAKYITRQLTNTLIKRGILKREKCLAENCNEQGEAHHTSYDSPYSVVWVCKLHHELIHHS